MQKNSPAFSPEEVLRLAQSPAGQQLLARLRQADPETISQIKTQAEQGAYDQAVKALEGLLQDPGR